MLDVPRTKEAATAYRYGEWAGNPRGRAFVPYQCAMEVYDRTGHLFYQCSKKPGHGPDDLFCKQHAKRVGS